MTSDVTARIARALDERFGTKIPLAEDEAGARALARMLEHRSHRRYSPRPVSNELLQLLAHGSGRITAMRAMFQHASQRTGTGLVFSKRYFCAEALVECTRDARCDVR